MNKTTKTYTWEGAGTPLPDGHRIFLTYDYPDGVGWAIADDSGHYPDQTDDGILWLDPTRCLMIMTDDSDPDRPSEHIAIPLVRENGERTRTPSDAATILMLSRLMRWTIEDETRGRFYNVR